MVDIDEWFNFIFGSNFLFFSFFCIVMYDNKFETKENKNWTKDKIEPKQRHSFISTKFLVLEYPSFFLSASLLVLKIRGFLVCAQNREEKTCQCSSQCPLFSGVTTGQPEIWFLDRSLEWWYLASSFTDYFRMMIVHLGLPLWQYLFTATGLSPETKVGIT